MHRQTYEMLQEQKDEITRNIITFLTTPSKRATIFNESEGCKFATAEIIKNLATEFENVEFPTEKQIKFKEFKQKQAEHFAKKEYIRITRQLLPDNALRMIELLENFQTATHFLDPTDYRKIIKGLMAAQDENQAPIIFNSLSKKRFTPTYLEQLRIASLSNADLLKAANDICETYFATAHHAPTYNKVNQKKENHCQEIEGRLLRPILPFKKRPIEELLLDTSHFDEEKECPVKSYGHVIREVAKDFTKHSEEMRKRLFPFERVKKDNPAIPIEDNNLLKERNLLLENDQLIIESPSIKDNGPQKAEQTRTSKYEYKPIRHPKKHKFLWDTIENWYRPKGFPYHEKDLLNIRDNMLNLESKLPSIKEPMEKNRRILLSYIHAAFVALGCFAIVGIPATLVAMYHSKRFKDTVFFTHAPDSAFIVPAAKECLKSLGKISPSKVLGKKGFSR